MNFKNGLAWLSRKLYFVYSRTFEPASVWLEQHVDRPVHALYSRARLYDRVHSNKDRRDFLRFAIKLVLYNYVILSCTSLFYPTLNSFTMAFESESFYNVASILEPQKEKVKLMMLEDLDKSIEVGRHSGEELLAISMALENSSQPELAYNLQYIAGLKNPSVGVNSEFSPEEYRKVADRLRKP